MKAGTDSAIFSSASDEWSTPLALFRAIESAYGPCDFDPCATAANAKCPTFLTKEIDGLRVPWIGDHRRAFVNPPYSNVQGWIEKCVAEACAGLPVVALVPARTDTRWWWYAMNYAESVRFLKGRVAFERPEGGATCAPFPSAVIYFAKHRGVSRAVKWWDWKKGELL